MPRQIRARVKLPLAASEYWELRDGRFADFWAETDGARYELLTRESDFDEQGREWKSRTSSTTFSENPVPRSLRYLLKTDEFSMVTRSRWCTGAWSKECASTYTTTVPAAGNRIVIQGTHWLEEDASGCCYACYNSEVVVRIGMGLGAYLEKVVEANAIITYDSLPPVVSKWVELQASLVDEARIHKNTATLSRSANQIRKSITSLALKEEEQHAQLCSARQHSENSGLCFKKATALSRSSFKKATELPSSPRRAMTARSSTERRERQREFSASLRVPIEVGVPGAELSDRGAIDSSPAASWLEKLSHTEVIFFTTLPIRGRGRRRTVLGRSLWRAEMKASKFKHYFPTLYSKNATTMKTIRL